VLAAKIEIVVDRLRSGGAEEIHLADAVIIKQPVGVGDNDQSRFGGGSLERRRGLRRTLWRRCALLVGGIWCFRGVRLRSPGRFIVRRRSFLPDRFELQSIGEGALELSLNQRRKDLFSRRCYLAAKFVGLGHVHDHAWEGPAQG